MNKILKTTTYALAGIAMLMASAAPRAVEITAGAAEAQSIYNSLLTQVNGLLGQLQGQINTLQSSVTTLTGRVDGIDASLNSLWGIVTPLNNNFNTLSGDYWNYVRPDYFKLRNCVYSHNAACDNASTIQQVYNNSYYNTYTTNITQTAAITTKSFTIGRQEDSGKLLDGTDLISTSGYDSVKSDGFDHTNRIYRYRSNIRVANYPYCAIVGGQGLSWKYYRLARGATYWEAYIEEWTNFSLDQSSGHIKVDCFRID